MTDFFALFNEPRRPWLDPEILKSRFHQLSGELHPDRAGSEAAKAEAQEAYTQLNAAYTCLREPKERLLHLLTLERGTKPKDVQSIPPEVMDWFIEMGKLCRETDAFLAEKAEASSPLLQVQLFERGEDLRERVNGLAGKLQARLSELEGQCKELNAEWERKDPLVLEQVEAIYRLMSYYTKWLAQLQERGVQLAL
jgi:DnaJ-domain-containing protein 1